MTALSDFRKRYPEYDEVSDKDLADALHSKYYSSIPIDDYYSQIGLDTGSGFFDATGEALKRTAGSFVTGTTGAVLGLGQFTPYDEESLDIQESIEAGTREFLGYDPAFDDTTAAQVGEVAGTIGSFLVPGTLAGKILNAGKVAKTSIAAGQGAGFGLTTGAKERQAAEQRGIDISEGQEALAKLSDAGIGSLEAFGLPFRVFRGLPRGFFKSEVGKGFQDRIESMIAGGLREGIQEAGAGIARDAAALAIYDPNRKIADSAIEDFTVGGIAGGVLDLALGAFGKKVPTIDEAMREEDLVEEGPARETQEKYEADVRAEESARKRRSKKADRMLFEAREEALEDVERSPLDIAIDYRRGLGSDIPRAELEFKSGTTLDDAQYDTILTQAQRSEETPILALPSPDSRKLAAQKAVEERLKKLKLSDRVIARVVDNVFPGLRVDAPTDPRTSTAGAVVDEEGNVTFQVDARDGTTDTYGAYQPTSKVIQLSVDQVFADAKGEPITEEVVVGSIIKTLNHEVYHALRNLDLLTQKEVDLLEKLARKYQKAGTKTSSGDLMSYAAWANSTYVTRNEKGDKVPELDPVRMAEESVAEMISDALAGKLMLDGKPVTLGGKPRTIIQKIVGFFKEMVGFTNDANARDLSDFLNKLESGDIGARQTEIRTPYLTQRKRARRLMKEQEEASEQKIADKPIVEQQEVLDDEEAQLESRRISAYRDKIDRSIARESFAKDIDNSGLESGAYVDEFEIDELDLTPESKRLMRALERDDYLGFDRVDDLFVQLFDEGGLENYDPSPQLKSAFGRYINEVTGMTGVDRPPEYSRRPESFTSVSFEIAPDPKNKSAVNRWNQMSESDKYSLSNRVGSEISQKIIEDTGAFANVKAQVGSYKEATNPSYEIKLDDGDPVKLAKNLGFVLDQESMSIISSENFEGAFKSNAIDIDVGNLDVSRIKEIYDTLRTVEGVPQITGQSTLDGNMLILLDQDANPRLVSEAFDRALDGRYDINFSEVFASFPEKPEYDYASLQVIPRKDGEDFRKRYLNFRSEAQAYINREIGQLLSDPRAGRGNAPNYDRTFEGAVRPDGTIILSHFSERKIPNLDPAKAGTGADRFKNNRPRSGGWLGITEAREDPYVKEPAIGPIETKFAMNLSDLYVIADPRNPQDLSDPRGVWTTFPDGVTPDYDAIIKKVTDLGYKGFVINSGHISKETGEFVPNLGKVAVVNEKLLPLDEAIYSRRTPEEINLTTRKRSPQKVEEAVVKDEVLAEEMQGPPRVSFVAEPEAQYVAQDPKAGYTPQFTEEQLGSRRTPDRNPSYQEAMNDAVGTKDKGPSQLETYMEATGEGKLSYWLTKFKQGAINRYARLEALSRDPNLRDNLADSSSIAAALFADRSRGVVASAIKYGVPVYRGGLTKVENFVHNNREYRGLVDLMGMLYSKEHGDLTQDAQAYAIAKRGGKLVDRKKDGKFLKAPLTPAQREEIINSAEKYLDAENNSIIKEWYSAWQAYNDYTIKFLRDTGVLDAETAQLWREGADYIPFYRAAGDGRGAPSLAKNIFGGDLTARAYIKEYKGSEAVVDVPMIEAIGLNLTAAIEMGMRNVAQQRIVRDMQKLGLARQLKNKEQAEAGLVTLKVDGKEVRFDVYDPLIYESMLAVPEMSGLVTGVFAKPANFLREMVTRDPGFMAVNMLRDTLSTYVTSGSDFVPVTATLGGLTEGIENLERSGVVGGYDYSNDPDDVNEFYAKEMKRRGIGPQGGRGSPVEMFKTIWDWAGNATTMSDAATRNAVYKDVLARTGNEAEAHFQALEIINFSRRGNNAFARVLTATIPFLNARFQGIDVFWRAGFGKYSANSELNRRRAMQSFYTRAGMLAGLTGLYYLLVSDNEQYKEQSEHIRDNNWILPTSSGVPMKLPIPFEVGFFFKVIPETIMALVNETKSAKEARETIQTGIVSTLEINILGVQAISPLVEAAMNHSFYTGRDIVPYYIDSGVATGLQDRVGTSQIAKFVGSELGISPIKIDHVLNGYGGTIGGYALSLIDTLLRSKMVTGDEASKMPALRSYEYPLIKRFFASKEGSGLKEDAYDLYREINKIVNTSNKLKREGRVDEHQSYLSSRQHILNLKSPVYSVKKRLDIVRKQREKVLRADLSAERKKEMLEDLDAELNEYLKVIPQLKKQANLPAFESRFGQRLTGS